MIAADTNLVIRHLTQDHKEQAEKVRNLFAEVDRQRQPVFLGHIVLCEVCWVLKSAYGMGKAQIVAGLEALLGDPGFQVQDRGLVETALQHYRQRAGQFSDHLLATVARHCGSSTTYTFDRAVAKLPNFTLLK